VWAHASARVEEAPPKADRAECTRRRASQIRYEGLGFALTDDVPVPLRFEAAAGRAITGAIGEELVVMRGVDR